MKLGAKLLLAPLLTAVVALAAGQFNAWMMGRESRLVETSNGALRAQTKTLADTHNQIGQIHAGVYRTVALMASLDEAKVKVLRGDLANQLQGAKRTLAAAAEETGDAALQSGATSAGTQLDAYLKAADSAIDLASVDPNTGVAAMQQADAAFDSLSKTVGAMTARLDVMGSEATSASQARSLRFTLLLGVLGLAAAAAAVWVSWRMQLKLVQALARACEVAESVANGNLSVDASTDRNDELGTLLRALNSMTEQLSESLRTVRDSSHSIQTASAEIASGNQDLSARTEEASSNLQKTASSMEELTSTVQQSAQSAATANQLAGSASQVAQRGGEVVGQVVATMEEINSSSKRIADIIGVIDGIAFQTNILALNAAVEAARAGEQGRGFAVVAAEVRQLAQRSAEAAKEIKSLIAASVERVETGARLVHEAGSTMKEIVTSVQRVTDIMAEIRASTVEQSQGIGTVNSAVAHLDQATQQNAALVEESAAAAESLKDQATTLSDVVNRFRLR